MEQTDSKPIPCPFCGIPLTDLHPNKIVTYSDRIIVEYACSNYRCSFGEHVKTISKEEAEGRLMGGMLKAEKSLIDQGLFAQCSFCNQALCTRTEYQRQAAAMANGGVVTGHKADGNYIEVNGLCTECVSFGYSPLGEWASTEQD